MLSSVKKNCHVTDKNEIYKTLKTNVRELSSMSHLREGWKAKCFIL